MAQNVYENMVIIDSNKYAQDPGGVSATIPALVLVSRLWNEQKLAYPMDGHRKGTYWLTYMRLDSQKLEEFNRQVTINEVIMRSLTLKVDARLVEALVEHAKGNRPRPVEAVTVADVEEDLDLEDVPE